MRRRSLAGSRWGLLTILLAVAGGVGVDASVAAADNAETLATSQAVAAHAQFLSFAPAPARPGVVCLIDTGVTRNPDTTAALVGAEALDPSWGTEDVYAGSDPLALGDAGHGTDMAMAIAAPRNGWGLVGLAPTAVRIYSIRDTPASDQPATLDGVDAAIGRCVQLHDTTQPAMTTINISATTTTPLAASELGALEDAVDGARADGLSVVAGAGNNGAAAPGYPAAYAPVVAVGAGDAQSRAGDALCGFSVRGQLDIVAPGCDSVLGGVTAVDDATGQETTIRGTSESAALVSATLAALRAYAPQLTADQAEGCLAGRAHQHALNVAAAFVACGLRRIVDAGLKRVPKPLRRPRLQAPVTVGGQTTFSVAFIPRGEILDIRWLQATPEGVSLVGLGHATSTRFAFNVPGSELAVRFIRLNSARASRWVTLRVR